MHQIKLVCHELVLSALLATSVRALAASHAPMWKGASGQRFTSRSWLISET